MSPENAENYKSLKGTAQKTIKKQPSVSILMFCLKTISYRIRTSDRNNERNQWCYVCSSPL